MRQRVYDAVRAISGHAYENDGRYKVDVTVWTPKGLVWTAGGSHTLAVSDFTDAASAWRDLWDRVQRGTEPCTNPNCDACEEGDEDCGCLLH